MIFYYVPEDKDELSTPNAFLMQCPMADITLEKIERQFPLPGAFIFRFKYSHSGQNVWLDLSNKKCPVPKYDNKIIINFYATVTIQVVIIQVTIQVIIQVIFIIDGTNGLPFIFGCHGNWSRKFELYI